LTKTKKNEQLFFDEMQGCFAPEQARVKKDPSRNGDGTKQKKMR